MKEARRARAMQAVGTDKGASNKHFSGHACTEQFVHSIDSDSAQLGPSQANLNFCAFDYVYCS